MALSEEEQRLLEQMEAALSQEDPQLANKLRGRSHAPVNRKRVALTASGIVVGVAILVWGMSVHPLVSVLGFVVMLATVVAALATRDDADTAAAGDQPDEPVTTPGSRASASGQDQTRQRNPRFMDRMEEQWRRRMEEGQ